MPNPTEIAKRFTSRSLSEAATDRVKTVSDGIHALAQALDDILPDGREKALALTHLQDAKMWSVEAIAKGPE